MFLKYFLYVLKADPSTLLGEDDVVAADLRQSFVPTSSEVNKSIGNDLIEINLTYELIGIFFSLKYSQI